MTDTRWPRGMRVDIAAEYIGLSVASIQTLRTAGDFPQPVKLTPGRLVFLRDDLDTWLDRRAGKVTPVNPDDEDGSEWLERLEQVKRSDEAKWMASVEKVRRERGFKPSQEK